MKPVRERHRPDPARAARSAHMPGIVLQMDAAVGCQAPGRPIEVRAEREAQRALDDAGEERGGGSICGDGRIGETEVALTLPQQGRFGGEGLSPERLRCVIADLTERDAAE